MVNDVEFSEVRPKRKGATMVDDVELSEVRLKRKGATMVDDVKFSEVRPKRKGATMVDDVELSEVRPKREKTNNMEGLVDELLVEILCRLPCCKTAVMCKSVCKYWAAMVSQPCFVSQFVAHKASRMIRSCDYESGVFKYDELEMKMMSDRTFGLVVRNIWGNTWKGLVIRFNDPINNPLNVSFSCLPKLANKGLPPRLTLAAACNDLLLYQRHGNDVHCDKLQLYISSLQTRQWLSLPSLHLEKPTRLIGLVCDPYYSNDTRKLTPDDTFHTCIIVIPSVYEELTKFPAHLLSRDTKGLWRSVVLSLPFRCQIVSFCPLFCIGRKLYFHCLSCLIGFDPFVDVNDVTSDSVIKCDSLPLPPTLVSVVAFFGVFREQLYMCDRDDDGRYRVWVLKDYETGQWSFRHSIMGQDWIPRDHSLAKLVSRRPLFGNAIGFHPANPDVIYVLSRRWVVLCNLSTRKMEIACKLPKYAPCLFPAGGSFQITLPVWPTPLPILL